jgi:hypothetical protein
MKTLAAQEEKLTLKIIQSHLIKTILGALGVALVGAFFTSYGFFYKTNTSIDILNSNKIETKHDVKELKKDVNDIKIALTNTGFYTEDNKEKIDNLEQDVKDIKKSQEEMMKLLFEIKSRQR